MMRKLIILLLLCLLSFYGYSQKVNVAIIKTRNAASSEWQILDENYRQVIREEEYPDADSIVFSLEAERRYFLQVSIIDILKPGVDLYSVRLDNEHILDAGSETEPGDYFYPFFTGTRKSQSKIIGGTDASISDFPWQIYLIAGNYRCGGSIIAPGWVITAAHCVKYADGTIINPSSFVIVAGSTTPYSFGTSYFVSQVTSHPSFSRETLENDVALLKVTGSISCTDCKPIKLMNAKNVADGYTDPGKIAYITGWGLTSATQTILPDNLQEATVPVISNATAAAVWGTIPATDIMAGYLHGNKDACSGDSGGPMSIFVDGEYKLAGVVSWGSKNCDTYGGYSRVSYFENWIRSITGIYDFTLPTPVGETVVCPGTVTSDYTEDLDSDAVDYEWRLLPSNAGTVSWIWEKATVTWNPGFIGIATIMARVRLSDSYSEWSEKKVNCARTTQLISQPGDTSMCVGDPLNLILSVEGTNLNCDWYKDGLLFKTGNEYYLSWLDIQESASGSYRCQLTGLCGTLSTDDMNVIVYPVTTINSISPDITTDYGSDITLRVDAGGHNLNYLWIRNGSPVENSNSPELSIQNADARNIGLYNTVVKGTCGTLISDSSYVYLKQSDAATAPVVSVWPTVITNEVNTAINNSDDYDVRIVNLSGKLMFSSLKNHYQTTINLSTYPKGLYILNIRNDNFNKSFKLVKE
jgi:hypothetical protein